MTLLIANSNDETKLKTIMTASEEFNRARGQLIKEKRVALNKFREKVTTRITLIFQSGTIEETVKPGIDYNEWLKEVEYAELIHLANEPEYKGLIPNTEDLIKEYIADQEKKYRSIKKSYFAPSMGYPANAFNGTLCYRLNGIWMLRICCIPFSN